MRLKTYIRAFFLLVIPTFCHISICNKNLKDFFRTKINENFLNLNDLNFIFAPGKYFSNISFTRRSSVDQFTFVHVKIMDLKVCKETSKVMTHTNKFKCISRQGLRVILKVKTECFQPINKKVKMIKSVAIRINMEPMQEVV